MKYVQYKYVKKKNQIFPKPVKKAFYVMCCYTAAFEAMTAVQLAAAPHMSL